MTESRKRNVDRNSAREGGAAGGKQHGNKKAKYFSTGVAKSRWKKGAGIPHGVEGILVTCLAGKEWQSAKEVISLLDQTWEEMTGQAVDKGGDADRAQSHAADLGGVEDEEEEAEEEDDDEEEEDEEEEVEDEGEEEEENKEKNAVKGDAHTSDHGLACASELGEASRKEEEEVQEGKATVEEGTLPDELESKGGEEVGGIGVTKAAGEEKNATIAVLMGDREKGRLIEEDKVDEKEKVGEGETARVISTANRVTDEDEKRGQATEGQAQEGLIGGDEAKVAETVTEPGMSRAVEGVEEGRGPSEAGTDVNGGSNGRSVPESRQEGDVREGGASLTGGACGVESKLANGSVTHGRPVPERLRPAVKPTMDIDKLLASECEEVRTKKSAKFSYIETGCKGLVFIHLRRTKGQGPGPSELAEKIVRRTIETKQTRTRYTMKILPAEVSCYPSPADVAREAAPLLARHFAAESLPLKFAVVVDSRAHLNLDRMGLINALAKGVPKPHSVDLNAPDKTIIVQVMKTTCTIAVIADYKGLAKYNVRQIVCPEVPGGSKASENKKHGRHR